MSCVTAIGPCNSVCSLGAGTREIVHRATTSRGTDRAKRAGSRKEEPWPISGEGYAASWRGGSNGSVGDECRAPRSLVYSNNGRRAAYSSARTIKARYDHCGPAKYGQPYHNARGSPCTACRDGVESEVWRCATNVAVGSCEIVS